MPKKTLSDRVVFETFVKAGEVVEVRTLGAYGKHKAWGGGFAKGVVAGYFDDHDAFVNSVKAVNGTDHGGIYFTLQKIDARLLGRAFNRLKPSIQTTSDNDVQAYRWLFIDIDPVRPAGISSSAAELQQAHDKATQVIAWLSAQGFSKPVMAMSGNGLHILYRLNETPVQEATVKFVQYFLQSLAARFDSPQVSIDTSVFNPARICRLYGTSAKKGDAIPQGKNRVARPHRASYIKDIPSPLMPVPDDALQTVLKAFQKESPVIPATTKARTTYPTTGGKLDVSQYLNHYKISHKVRQKNGSTFYCLDTCVFDENHRGNEAAIIQDSNGKLLYQCFHNSCQGRHWKDAREIISQADKIVSFLQWSPDNAKSQQSYR
jgi:hypothetical protein